MNFISGGFMPSFFLKNLVLLSISLMFIFLATDIKAEETPHKWKVIYIEGGPNNKYFQMLNGLVHALEARGIISLNNEIRAISTESDSEFIWNLLVNEAKSSQLEFLADGYYSAGWDMEKRGEIKQNVLKRLNNPGEVDLVLAFGTWAGQDVATNEHHVPVMSMFSSDPVKAGISQSYMDSGLEHIHVMVQKKTEKQIRFFYDLFKFKRLGVPVERNPSERSPVVSETIADLAEELGFKLDLCEADLSGDDTASSFQNLYSCLEDLSERSDAIYLTANSGMHPANMSTLLRPLIKAGIPSFSQSGADETKLGVLMSLGRESYENMGHFEAHVLDLILKGHNPRQINQIYEVPLTLALNIKMALAIGWNPPFRVLANVDEFFQQFGSQGAAEAFQNYDSFIYESRF